jgi:hypothetical protein
LNQKKQQPRKVSGRKFFSLESGVPFPRLKTGTPTLAPEFRLAPTLSAALRVSFARILDAAMLSIEVKLKIGGYGVPLEGFTSLFFRECFSDTLNAVVTCSKSTLPMVQPIAAVVPADLANGRQP